MIAIYARQSVLKEDSLSIQDQIEQCKRLVPQDESFKVYQDQGFSGKNTLRPDFERLMFDIERGLISKVIVYKLDRFSRSSSDFRATMDIFEKYDVEFQSTDGISNKGDLSRLFLTIVAEIAQMERSNLIARVSDNYMERVRMGFFLGGPVPFGFSKEPFIIEGKKTARLIPDEKTADIVIEMFQKYAYDETMTLGKLKKWLVACDVNTSKGFSWTGAALSRVIRNPVYVKADADVYTYLHDIKGASHHEGLDISRFTGEYGLYTYTLKDEKSNVSKDTGTDEDNNRKKDKFAHMDKVSFTLAPHKGLIDSETWLRCQYRLDKNAKFKGVGTGSHTWLSGIMKCGYCGYAMTVTSDIKRGTTYLSCGGRKLGNCYERKNKMQAFELETIVEEILFERMREIKRIHQAEPIQDNRKVNGLKLKMLEVEKTIQSLTNRLALLDDLGAIEVAKAINRQAEIKRKLSQELEEALKEQQSKNYSRYDIDDYIAHWNEYDIETKKKISRIFIDKVMVDDEKIVPIFK